MLNLTQDPKKVSISLHDCCTPGTNDYCIVIREYESLIVNVVCMHDCTIVMP